MQQFFFAFVIKAVLWHNVIKGYKVLLMKKLNASKVIYIILSACFIAVLALFYAVCITGQTAISETEMRTLQQIPSFSAEGFGTGVFQTELEDSIADQLRFGEQIKYIVKQGYNALTSCFSKAAARTVLKTDEVEIAAGTASVSGLSGAGETGIESSTAFDAPASESGEGLECGLPDGSAALPESEPKQTYHYIYQEVVADSLYKLDDSGYIIQMWAPPEKYDFNLYDPDMLAAVTYPKYMLFIDTPLSTDFNHPGESGAYEYVKAHMPVMTDYAQLTFENFEDYKNWFYQTDHHWNYRGSYLGYTLCMKMLEGPDVELRVPVGTHTYPAIYNGSLARDNLLRCSTEQFTVYEFDIPAYKTYVDDEEAEYGWRSWYVSDDDFPHKVYSNHYGMYYGDDHAKVVYDFDNPNEESILILATSWSNAINELIASHYNETHVLDFRHYRNTYGEGINAQKYMDEYGLTKLLILGDISSLGHKRKE